MRGPLSVLALLYGIAMLQQLLWVAVALPITVAFGIAIKDVQFGSLRLIKFKVRGIPVTLGPLPTASMDMANDGGTGRRVAVRLLPWLVVFGICLVLLGPSHALRSFGRAFGQLLLTPDLTGLCEQFLAFARTAPFSTLFGVVVVKMTALNILPLVGMSGGGVIHELFTARRDTPPAWWMFGSIAIMLWVVVRCAWGLISAL